MSKGYKILHFLLAWIFRAVYRVKVIFPENEPDPGKAYIMCANHLSAMDPILICAGLKKLQPRYMAKDSLFKVPVISSLIKAFGAYPVNRNGSALSAIKKSMEILGNNDCIGIFPQGHRHPGISPRDTEVKNGVGMICAKTGSDLIPICIKPKNYKYMLFFRKTYIIIGKPISYNELPITEDMSSSDKNKAITEYVFDKICSLGENYEA